MGEQSSPTHTHNSRALGLMRYKLHRKIHKFSDTRKNCCNLSKIQTKMPNLREFHQKGANSEVPDQTADLGLHCLPRPFCPKT